MKLNFTWKDKTMRYQSGEALYLNRVRVGEYFWDATRSKDEESKDEDYLWTGKVYLPSLRKDSFRSETQDEIKGKIESVVKEWFEEVSTHE